MSMIPYSYGQPITSNNTFSFGQPISQVQNAEFGNGSNGPATQNLNLNYDIPLNIGSGTQALTGQYGASSTQPLATTSSSDETGSASWTPTSDCSPSTSDGYQTPCCFSPWDEASPQPNSGSGSPSTPLNIFLNVEGGNQAQQGCSQSSNNSNNSMMMMLMMVLLLKLGHNNSQSNS